MSTPAACCEVELFGVARLRARTSRISVELSESATLAQVLSALALKLPALVGPVITTAGDGLTAGHVCNFNGRDFVRDASRPVAARGPASHHVQRCRGMIVHGFHNRLLHVDLGTGRHRWQETGADRLRAFLGGIGLGTSLLYDFAPPGVEPLAPENPLIFASAPLAGTGLTTTAKYAVVTKSPLTGFIADSLSSSFFALELKAVGVDAVVVTGRAAAPVYLFIDNRGVELRDARHLWGGSAADTETAVRAELGNPTARVASVGTAGENRVRFATISNEGRHAGRGGVGAVMGSKNLKAIALSGNARVSVADADGVAAIAATLRQRSLGEHTAKYREIGTVANLAVFDRLGALPTRNFQQSTFAGADGLSGESLTENSFSRRHGCASCTIRCERLFKSQSGNEQRMEYETLFALGPLCGIEDPGGGAGGRPPL